MTTIRDQIINILAGPGDEVSADVAERTDLVLTALTEWMTGPGMDFRLALALAGAAPGKFEYGVHGDAELTDAALAVAHEIAKVMRPAPKKTPAGATR